MQWVQWAQHCIQEHYGCMPSIIELFHMVMICTVCEWGWHVQQCAYLLIMYSACIELAGCLPVRYHCEFWMHIAYLLAYFIHADVPAAFIVVYSNHCVWGCHWKLTVVIWTRCHSTYLLSGYPSCCCLYIKFHCNFTWLPSYLMMLSMQTLL